MYKAIPARWRALHKADNTVLFQVTGDALYDFEKEIQASQALPTLRRLAICKFIHRRNEAVGYDRALLDASNSVGISPSMKDVLKNVPSIVSLEYTHTFGHLVSLLFDFHFACSFKDRDLLDDLLYQLNNVTPNPIPANPEWNAKISELANFLNLYTENYPAYIPPGIYTMTNLISQNVQGAQHVSDDALEVLLSSNADPKTFSDLGAIVAKILVNQTANIVPFVKKKIGDLFSHDDLINTFLSSILLQSARHAAAKMEDLVAAIITDPNFNNEGDAYSVFYAASDALVTRKNDMNELHRSTIEVLNTHHIVGGEDITQGLTDYLTEGKNVATKLEKYFWTNFSDATVFESFVEIDAILTSHTLDGWMRRIIFAKFLRHRYGDVGFTTSVSRAIAEGATFPSQKILTWLQANPTINQQDLNQLHPELVNELVEILTFDSLNNFYPDLFVATISVLVQKTLDPWTSGKYVMQHMFQSTNEEILRLLQKGLQINSSKVFPPQRVLQNFLTRDKSKTLLILKAIISQSNPAATAESYGRHFAPAFLGLLSTEMRADLLKLIGASDHLRFFVKGLEAGLQGTTKLNDTITFLRTTDQIFAAVLSGYINHSPPPQNPPPRQPPPPPPQNPPPRQPSPPPRSNRSSSYNTSKSSSSSSTYTSTSSSGSSATKNENTTETAKSSPRSKTLPNFISPPSVEQLTNPAEASTLTSAQVSKIEPSAIRGQEVKVIQSIPSHVVSNLPSQVISQIPPADVNSIEVDRFGKLPLQHLSPPTIKVLDQSHTKAFLSKMEKAQCGYLTEGQKNGAKSNAHYNQVCLGNQAHAAIVIEWSILTTVLLAVAYLQV